MHLRRHHVVCIMWSVVAYKSHAQRLTNCIEGLQGFYIFCAPLISKSRSMCSLAAVVVTYNRHTDLNRVAKAEKLGGDDKAEYK